MQKIGYLEALESVGGLAVCVTPGVTIKAAVIQVSVGCTVSNGLASIDPHPTQRSKQYTHSLTGASS